MKLSFLPIVLLTGCLPFVGGPKCNQKLDNDRIERAKRSAELVATTVRVRYVERSHMAIVSGYDIRRKLVQSEQIPLTCSVPEIDF